MPFYQLRCARILAAEKQSTSMTLSFSSRSLRSPCNALRCVGEFQSYVIVVPLHKSFMILIKSLEKIYFETRSNQGHPTLMHFIFPLSRVFSATSGQSATAFLPHPHYSPFEKALFIHTKWNFEVAVGKSSNHRNEIYFPETWDTPTFSTRFVKTLLRSQNRCILCIFICCLVHLPSTYFFFLTFRLKLLLGEAFLYVMLCTGFFLFLGWCQVWKFS